MWLSQKGEFIDFLMPIAYFMDNNRVLLRKKSEMFFWYDVEKEQLGKFLWRSTWILMGLS